MQSQSVFFYIDDSGVFHNKGDRYTIFAGYVFYNRFDRDNASRIFKSLEDKIKNALSLDSSDELKSYDLDPKYKRRLYSVLNRYHRFSCVIDNSIIKEDIWTHKKHKQRFLDYALKRQIKETLKVGFRNNLIDHNKITNVHIFFDQHTTATSGHYELSEGIKEELIHGTFNFNYSLFFEPILPKGSSVDLTYSDSKDVILIRAADNVANRVFFELNRNGKQFYEVQNILKHHCCRKFP